MDTNHTTATPTTRETPPTPEGYRAPLKSRAAILEYLKNGGRHTAQGWHGGGSYLFAWNVKAHSVELEFDHLLNLEGGDWKEEDSHWLKGCLERWEECDKGALFWEALADCQRDVNECDTYRGLWDDSTGNAEWTFEGRSSGWICLNEFDGVDLTGSGHGWEGLEGDGDEWGQDPGMDLEDLRRLYRFVVQCGHDFRPEGVKAAVEYAAAFLFFVNVCADVENTEERRARWSLDQSGEHDTPTA